MAIAAPLHAERVPEEAVGDHFPTVKCSGQAFGSPKAYVWWRQAPPTLCNVIAQNVRVGELFFEALDQRMHSVLRNEVGHMCRHRIARRVDLHALAQVVAVLSRKALVDDLFVEGGLLGFVVADSYAYTICLFFRRGRTGESCRSGSASPC